MPRDYHTEFSLTAGSSCIINKECSETRLSSQTDAHCVFPGETTFHYSACLKTCLITISTSHSVQRYSIIPDKTCILFLCWLCITYSFPFPSELLPICCLAVFHLVQAHFQLTEVTSGASSCFFTACRIYLLFKFLLFSCYFLFPGFPPRRHWFRDTIGMKT